MAASCQRRNSYGESSQWEITPLSPQALHCHRIGVPASAARITIIRPGQAR